ncbi:protein of unknown function [Methylocaldum szegediense]|uniref:Secreted protein n=1 Tax=Methylocaldum szegediense TaxID=73780 RepID=A0ABM9I0D6_9GAMM|nr:protein of unknown function [Methylocaldum szegediense]
MPAETVICWIFPLIEVIFIDTSDVLVLEALQNLKGFSLHCGGVSRFCQRHACTDETCSDEPGAARGWLFLQ